MAASSSGSALGLNVATWLHLLVCGLAWRLVDFRLSLVHFGVVYLDVPEHSSVHGLHFTASVGSSAVSYILETIQSTVSKMRANLNQILAFSFYGMGLASLALIFRENALVFLVPMLVNFVLGSYYWRKWKGS